MDGAGWRIKLCGCVEPGMEAEKQTKPHTHNAHTHSDVGNMGTKANKNYPGRPQTVLRGVAENMTRSLIPDLWKKSLPVVPHKAVAEVSE